MGNDFGPEFGAGVNPQQSMSMEAREQLVQNAYAVYLIAKKEDKSQAELETLYEKFTNHIGLARRDGYEVIFDKEASTPEAAVYLQVKTTYWAERRKWRQR